MKRGQQHQYTHIADELKQTEKEVRENAELAGVDLTKQSQLPAYQPDKLTIIMETATKFPKREERNEAHNTKEGKEKWVPLNIRVELQRSGSRRRWLFVAGVLIIALDSGASNELMARLTSS